MWGDREKVVGLGGIHVVTTGRSRSLWRASSKVMREVIA